jgi:hypothetical protein
MSKDVYKHDNPNFDCKFDISPIACKLKGAMRATIYEDGQKGPQEHIDISNDWWVDVEWVLKGHLTRHLCGSFCIGVHLESIGTGQEYSLGPHEVKMDPCGKGYYRYRFKVPAGTISADDCGKLYIVAVTLTSLDYCGGHGHINAFCKEGCVMFVNPPA